MSAARYVIAAVLLAATTAWLVHSRGPSQTTSETSKRDTGAQATRAGFAELRRELLRSNQRYRQLAGQQEVLQRQLDYLGKAEDLTAYAQYESEQQLAQGDDAGRHPEDVPSDDERLAALVTRLEHHLEGQDMDPSWSEDAAEQVSDYFARGALDHSQLLSVECRWSSCRMEVVHDEQQGVTHFAETLPDSLPWNGEAFFYTFTEWGETHTVVFLSREDYALSDASHSG